MGKREFRYNIMEEIKQRWSTRAFSAENISDDDIFAVIEAAHYAPSCFNAQPWRYLIAKKPAELEKMRAVLTGDNQKWANKAPVLLLIMAYTKFEYNGKPNRWNQFDAGASWGYLSLEAHRRGLVTHAMGGFSQLKAREVFNISEEYDLLAVVALGKPGDKKDLPDDIAAREEPGIRKPLEDVIL